MRPTESDSNSSARVAGVEREEPVDDQVPFAENLDVQTRAELDEVLERSIMLVRDVVAALYRR